MTAGGKLVNRAARVLALVAGASLACNGLLGITDGVYVPEGLDASASDASASDASAQRMDAGDARATLADAAKDGADAQATTGDAGPCNPSTCPTGCVQGGCVVTLASGYSFGTIAVDLNGVYVDYGDLNNVGHVASVPLSGGAVTSLDVAATGVVVTDPLANPPTVCWVTGGGDIVTTSYVKCMPSAGGPVSLLFSESNSIGALAASGGTLYLPRGAQPFGIYSMREDTPDGAAFLITDAGAGAILLAINAIEIYFVSRASSALYRAPLAGGAATLVPQANAPVCLAADSANIYWADVTGVQKVAVSAPADAAAETIAAFPVAQYQPSCILVADTSQTPTELYMDNIADDTLRKMSSAGGGSTILASGQGFGGIAVDGTSVYWTASVVDDAGVIRKRTPK